MRRSADQGGRKRFLAVPVGSCDTDGMAATNDLAAQPPQRLARLVTQRRAALGWSKEKAADEAGVAHMTYRRIEGGYRVQARSYAKIEVAFDFKPGSCQAVLDGADSITLTDGTELIEGANIFRPSTADLGAAAREAVRVAATLTTPEMTLAKAQELSERAVEEMQKRGLLPPEA